jgi:hypothetical protein
VVICTLQLLTCYVLCQVKLLTSSILGSSFLKNVYSIYQYPDQSRTTTWQPTVGLVSLVNATVAAQDFYAVRNLRQSLSAVSANQASVAGTTPYSPPSTTSANSNNNPGTGAKTTSTAIIIACSIVGFFVLAIAAFVGWWFWRRKNESGGGAMGYGRRRKRKSDDDSSRRSEDMGMGMMGLGMGMGRPETHRSDHSTSTLRSKKHEEVQRQKSMIEGYGVNYYDEGEVISRTREGDRDGDNEGDSWTEGGDSIRLGYIPELLEEEDNTTKMGTRMERASSGGSTPARGRSDKLRSSGLRETSVPKPEVRPAELNLGGNNGEDETDMVDLIALSPPKSHSAPRSRSRSQSRVQSQIRSSGSTSLSAPLDSGFDGSNGPGMGTASGNMSGPYPQPVYNSPTNANAALPSTTANPTAQAQSQARSKSKSRGLSMNMSGPFPTPNRTSLAQSSGSGHGQGQGQGQGSGVTSGVNGRAGVRKDSSASPMYEYDIRTSDYFGVPIVHSQPGDHQWSKG